LLASWLLGDRVSEEKSAWFIARLQGLVS